MKILETKIEDLLVLEPEVFTDDRGFFLESFNQKKFDDATGREIKFVQDNHSFSKKDTLRGIHYQLNPNAQGKLVRVVSGEVLDVAVDLRTESKTFGEWCGVILNEYNNKQFWVPEGFGHGFVVLSDSAHFLYKTTAFYSKESERSIIWNDSDLNINWGVKDPLLSKKDLESPKFNNSDYF